MKSFEFSSNVINSVLNELRNADKFIKIAIFQIHLDELFDLLELKIKEGILVDIFTLPYDSINESIKEKVTKRL